jgi:hypothetical protein
MRSFSQQAVKLAASIPLPGRSASDREEAAIEATLRESVDESRQKRAS